MFGDLFKVMTVKNPLTKEVLWEDTDVRWFIKSNNLELNKDCYSEEDLMNIKKAVEEKRERNKEENRKKLYEVLKSECNYIPDSEEKSNE